MSNGDAEEALWAVHGRLGAIEGKVNLIVRADPISSLRYLRRRSEKTTYSGRSISYSMASAPSSRFTTC